MRTVIFENNLLCTAGDFLEDTEKKQCICCFCSLRWIILCWCEMNSGVSLWLGMGFADRLSKPNSISLSWRSRCRCECNLILFRTPWGFLQGGIREQPPAWRGVRGCSLPGVCAWQRWIMGALRACRMPAQSLSLLHLPGCSRGKCCSGGKYPALCVGSTCQEQRSETPRLRG